MSFVKVERLLPWAVLWAVLCLAPSIHAQHEYGVSAPFGHNRRDSGFETSDFRVLDTDEHNIEGGFRYKGADSKTDGTEGTPAHSASGAYDVRGQWHSTFGGPRNPASTQKTSGTEETSSWGLRRPGEDLLGDIDAAGLSTVHVEGETERQTTEEHFVSTPESEYVDVTLRLPGSASKQDENRERNGSGGRSEPESYTAKPEQDVFAEQDSVLHAGFSARLQERPIKKDSLVLDETAPEQNNGTKRNNSTDQDTPEVDTNTPQNNSAEGAEEGEPVLVTTDEVENGCGETCVRKCCPVGLAYDMSTGTCQKTQEQWESPEGAEVVVGLPRCRHNFTAISITRTDGKRRLKLESYGVAYEMYCTDYLLEEGEASYKSLVCNDILEESRIVNIIRKTSIIGNIVSALCITAIYVCHVFIPKLNEKQGSIFIIFCTTVFAKSVIEAPERWVQFTAYPNYTVCVINSIFLMFFKTCVPHWLSVLCVDIARRASAIGNLFRMVNSTSGRRRWLLIYFAYGIGLPILQLLLAFLITNLGNKAQRQIAVYDRMCIFTNEDVLNWVFLYPRIGLASSCSFLLLYAHRHRKTWCTPTVINGQRTVKVDHVDRAQVEDGDSGGEGKTHQNNLTLFRAHSAFDFVAEFWQQVSLVFFWILLMISTMLMELTGDGVLSHITNLMDSYQGLYVCIIFVFNRQKRDLVRNKLSESLKSFTTKEKTPCLDCGLPGRSGVLDVEKLPCRSTRPRKEEHQQAVLSAEVSTLRLTKYSPRRSAIPNGFRGGNQGTPPISVPPAACPSLGLPHVNNASSTVEDSSLQTSHSPEVLAHTQDSFSVERLASNSLSCSSNETLLSLVSRELGTSTSSETPPSENLDHESNFCMTGIPSSPAARENPKSPTASETPPSPKASQSPVLTESSSFPQGPPPSQTQASEISPSSESQTPSGTTKFHYSPAPRVSPHPATPAPLEAPASSHPPSDLPTSKAKLSSDAHQFPENSQSAVSRSSSEAPSLSEGLSSLTLSASSTSPTSLEKFILPDSPQEEIVPNQGVVRPAFISPSGDSVDGQESPTKELSCYSPLTSPLLKDSFDDLPEAETSRL